MSRSLTIKDPNCLQIIITPILGGDVVQGFIGGGQTGIGSAATDSLILSEAIVLQGVFADDGAYATLESTSEEDTFTETADGQTCVYVKRRNNEILTIRLNSCNGYVDALIELKNRRYGVQGVTPTPLNIHICDLCTGYQLIARCAWMISNPTISFGNDDSPVEIKFLLADVGDNITFNSQIFDDFNTI